VISVTKRKKEIQEACLKKHTRVFLEARYLGVQKSIMKNASLVENV
jgi:hypothetical protein